MKTVPGSEGRRRRYRPIAVAAMLSALSAGALAQPTESEPTPGREAVERQAPPTGGIEGADAAMEALLANPPELTEREMAFVRGETQECRDCNLSLLNFRSRDLTGVDLAGANLTASIFFSTNLTGANLQGTDLSGTDFTNANLTDANLRNVTARGTLFYLATMTRADLSGAYGFNANFQLATLQRTRFADADFYYSFFQNAVMGGAILAGGLFNGSVFAEVRVSNVDMRGAVMEGVDFAYGGLTGTDMTGAILTGSDFYGARFDEANLTGADFSGARLLAASLTDADLTATNFDGAILPNGATGEGLSEEDGVMAALAQWSARYGWSTGPETIVGVYHPDAVFWGTGATTPFVGRDSFAPYFASQFDAYPTRRVTFIDPVIRVMGDSATATGLYRFEVATADGQAVEQTLRFSFALTRADDGGWLIVQQHSSALPGSTPAAAAPPAAAPEPEPTAAAALSCPDPAVVALSVADVTSDIQGELATYTFELVATVENVGGADYVSTEGRQSVALFAPGRGRVAVGDFAELPAGGSVEVSAGIEAWDPIMDSGNFIAVITLNPGNYTDSDPSNDDCGPASNNSLIIGVAEMEGLLFSR